ncbi:MAG: ABC transporter permease [Herpetosiphon sp.]
MAVKIDPQASVIDSASSDTRIGAKTNPPRSNVARAWRRFRNNRQALVALVVGTAMILLAINAGLLQRYVTHVGPLDQRLINNFEDPSSKHWLGTDEYGRDVLMRIAYGGRASLGVAALAVLIALTVGVSVGALAAYYGGWTDTILMRFVDIMLSIPTIFLFILIGALFKVKPLTLAVLIALLGWFGLSRLIRSEVLSVKQRDYVSAAQVVGANDWAIVTRHILPNVVHIIIVWATLAVPGFILTEAALSFLGFGVQPPTPSWGNMLTNSTQYFYHSKRLVLIPGAFITVTVLALSIVGDALRDALDPRLNE